MENSEKTANFDRNHLVMIPKGQFGTVSLPSNRSPVRCPLVCLLAAGVFITTPTPLATARLEPDGSNDATYLAAGQTLTLTNQLALGNTNQTVLLSFTIAIQYMGSALYRNTTATLLDSENAITTTDNITDLLAYSPSYSVGTGPNCYTNAGTVIQIDHIAMDTDDYIAVLHLASPLQNVHTRIATNRPAPGQIITEAGFGYFGTPSGGAAGAKLDGNSRAWRASMSSTTFGGYSSAGYFSTDFSTPYIPLNGQGLQEDSGGIACNETGEIVGVTLASASGLPAIGYTVCVDVTQSNTNVYNFIVRVASR